MKNQLFLALQKVPVVTRFAVILAGCSTVTVLAANNGPEERISKVPAVRVGAPVPVPVLPVLAAAVESPLGLAVAPGEFAVKSIDEQKLSSSLKEILRAQVRLMREHKVLPVSDDKVPDFSAEAAHYRAKTLQHADRPAEKSITFVPANVDATSLRGAPMVGAIPHGVRNKEIWSGLSRMIIHPHLGHVVLEETDLKTTGGGAVLTKEMISADVNGAPAVIVSRQGKTKSVTSVSWYSDGMLYLLRTTRVDDNSRDELLDIARGIGK